MADRVDTLRTELDRAVGRLRLIVQDAHAQWVDDTLIGKDAGPAATTTLIPADALPEIEDSSLAKQMFTQIKHEHADRLEGDLLDRFITRWVDRATNRAFFSLGSSDQAEETAAEESLVQVMLEDARDLALNTGVEPDRHPRLPPDLAAAAEPAPGTLHKALSGLVSLSRSVCWSWEEGRFQLDGGDADAGGQRPTVTSVIAHDPTLADKIDEIAGPGTKTVTMPDPERVVALSVEWAVPIHALHDITNWKASYERIQRLRIDRPDRHAPSHIDRRFAVELDPLVPQYFETEGVARQIGKALVLKMLLDDKTEDLLDGYDHSLTHPAVPPIRLDADGRYLGRVIRVVGGRLRAADDDIELGTSWSDVLKEVGESHALRVGIDDVAVWTTRRLDAQIMLDAIDRFLNELLEPLIDANQQSPNEVTVLSHVFDQLAGWQVTLRSLLVAG